jgi:large subunit ribosomal protein L30
MTTAQSKRIRIKWVKSVNNQREIHKRTIKALGFRKLQSEVVHDATPSILGMANSVRHLVQVTEVSE